MHAKAETFSLSPPGLLFFRHQVRHMKREGGKGPEDAHMSSGFGTGQSMPLGLHLIDVLS